MKTVTLLGIALAIGLPAGAQSDNNIITYTTSPESIVYTLGNQASVYSANPRSVTYQAGKSGNWITQSTGSKSKPNTYTWSTRNKPLTFTQGYTWTAPGVYEDTTIKHIDIRNEDVRHALKSVFEAAQRDYEVIDKDLPDVRISLKADNIKLSTALEVITQSAGLSWKIDKQKDKSVYHIGKNVSSSSYVTLSLADANQNVVLDPTTNKIRATYPNNLQLDPSASKIYENVLRNSPTVTSPNVSSVLWDTAAANLFTYNTTEERSTFTCPHCKGQATVIRHRQVPKCPKCGRDFQNEWQFCPFDGSKKPTTTSAWHFCPICGKEVEPEKKAGN